MRQLLQEQGIETVGTALPDECWHMLHVKRDLKPLRDSGAEAIVCLACGDGTQTVAANTEMCIRDRPESWRRCFRREWPR